MRSRDTTILEGATGPRFAIRTGVVATALLSLAFIGAARVAAQPETGQTAYREACAECHGTRLQGGAHGPALSGVSFTSVWGSRSADDLFQYIRAEMPPGQSQSLSDAAYRRIVDLILESDGRAANTEVESAATDAERAEPVGRTTRFGDREAAGLTPVTDALLQDPPAADWLTWRRTLDNHGYSPLAQITRDNVDGLRLAWVLSMRDGVNQTTPVVHDGVMFLANPGNVVQAIDAARGELIWEYRYEFPSDALTGVGATRGLALYEDKVFRAPPGQRLEPARRSRSRRRHHRLRG